MMVDLHLHSHPIFLTVAAIKRYSLRWKVLAIFRMKARLMSSMSGSSFCPVLFFLLLAEVMPLVLALTPGYYQPYDTLCSSNGSKVAAAWDCDGYIQCQPGAEGWPKAMWVGCDPGLQYDPQAEQCVKGYTGCQTPQAAASTYCQRFPDLVFVHPDSCALLYHCSQSTARGQLRQYEAECSYPRLFDANTLRCVPRPQGNLTDLCGRRAVPVSACDYKKECSASALCQNFPDGDYAHPLRPFTEYYVTCQNGGVLREGQCDRTGQIFDPVLRQCIFGLRDDSVTQFCNQTTFAVFPDPYNCARHFDCSQTIIFTGLRARQSECHYPLLYDVNATKCTNFNMVKCGNREEPVQPCEYMIGHCLDRPECIPCQTSCVGLPDGYNAYPGYILTAYHILCQLGRTLDILNCSTGLIFDPQTRACSAEISLKTLDLFCGENPDGKLAHPSECSLLYDCTRLTDKPNFSKYVSECKYPYLVDASTVQCKPHDQVSCGERREPISPCDYRGYKCTSTHCKSCELVMPSCYGKLNGFYPLINQEMTSSYMECQDQRVFDLKSCPGGLIFDMVGRKCVDTVSEVSMLQYCTLYLTGRVQQPGNCAQYYDCTQNLTSIQECRYPDLYDVTLQECRHYSEVDCQGRQILLNPCDSRTFCPITPCPYCPTAFPTCNNRNGVTSGFVFDKQLYYRCIDNRMILGRCLYRFDGDKNRCNDSSVSSATPTSSVRTSSTTMADSIPSTATKAPLDNITTRPPATTHTTTTTTTIYTTTTINTTTKATTRMNTTTTRKPTTGGQMPNPPSYRDVNTTCMRDPGFVTPKGGNCAQYYNCSKPLGPLGPYVSECAVGELFDAATGMCALRHLVNCHGRPAPSQVCHYRLQQCPFAGTGSSCSPCPERFPSCWGKPDGPVALPSELSATYVYCQKGLAAGIRHCPAGHFLDPTLRRCSTQLTMNTTFRFCMDHPNAVSSNPLHCARYILCKKLGSPPLQGECPYPKLFLAGQCLDFEHVQCGDRYEPKAPCDYASLQKCPDKTRCSRCEERFPSCEKEPDGLRPYPGRLFTPWFMRCSAERTMAVVRCVHSLFDPVTKECGHTLDQILERVARAPDVFCQEYPKALAADPLHCARYYNCSRDYPGLMGKRYLSECHFPSLFNRQTMECDSFITVQRNVGCGRGKQPLHQCEYSSYCPGSRYRTCRDCYNSIPSCRGIRDGIHTIPPGGGVSKAFVYCLDQRALVFSQCPQGFVYYDAAKTCVLRNSQAISPIVLAAVTEPPEV